MGNQAASRREISASTFMATPLERHGLSIRTAAGSSARSLARSLAPAISRIAEAFEDEPIALARSTGS